jgi:hypothetical protein
MVSPNMAGYERRKAMGIGRFLDDTTLDRQQLKESADRAFPCSCGASGSPHGSSGQVHPAVEAKQWTNDEGLRRVLSTCTSRARGSMGTSTNSAHPISPE